MKHEGAVSSQATFPRTAVCIYSGNRQLYELTTRYWNEDKQLALDFKYMRESCDCNSCRGKREDRRKIRAALEREADSRGMKALGW